MRDSSIYSASWLPSGRTKGSTDRRGKARGGGRGLGGGSEGGRGRVAGGESRVAEGEGAESEEEKEKRGEAVHGSREDYSH